MVKSFDKKVNGLQKRFYKKCPFLCKIGMCVMGFNQGISYLGELVKIFNKFVKLNWKFPNYSPKNLKNNKTILKFKFEELNLKYFSSFYKITFKNYI